MGLSDTQLDRAFPELVNFEPRDLGFLSDGPVTEPELGDANCDGVVDADDVTGILGRLVARSFFAPNRGGLRNRITARWRR